MLLRTLAAQQVVREWKDDPAQLDWSLAPLRLAREGVRRWVSR